ncbi:MAG: RagB/SusD family nutrient uptake outer membrane protein, partial [Bacteroidetes bacterium]|nr:RagB/SusD family nutrient uptake outer membrane protein [Bacteroidota bacterium]
LEQLLAERGRELFAEGHRRQDLIRFGEFTKSWWAKGDDQGGVAGDKSVLTFPIPKWATDVNPNLLKDPQ